jgi:hypothetical protein
MKERRPEDTVISHNKQRTKGCVRNCFVKLTKTSETDAQFPIFITPETLISLSPCIREKFYGFDSFRSDQTPTLNIGGAPRE